MGNDWGISRNVKAAPAPTAMAPYTAAHKSVELEHIHLILLTQHPVQLKNISPAAVVFVSTNRLRYNFRISWQVISLQWDRPALELDEGGPSPFRSHATTL